jgi:serralysin
MATVVASSPSNALLMPFLFPFAPGGLSTITDITIAGTAVVTGPFSAGSNLVLTYSGANFTASGTTPIGGTFTSVTGKVVQGLTETEIGTISGITRADNFGEIDTSNAHLILFGDDDITGSDKQDFLLTGDGGNDTVKAKDGNDFIIVAAVNGAPFHSIDGGAGTDFIVATRNLFSTETTLDLRNSTLKSIEAIGFDESAGTSFSGSIIVASSQLAAGKVSPSSQVGGTGTFHVVMNHVGLLDLSALQVDATVAVVVDGTSGNDTIVGTSVADTFQPGAGKDTVSGGDGNDVFQLAGDEAEFDSINGGAGTDTVEATDTAVLLSGFDAAASSIETWHGGAFGNASDNLFDFRGLTSQATSEFGTPFLEVVGFAGNDTLIGSKFRDAMSGGDDNDALSGDDGDDFLSGDGGRDTLTGGAGLDVFQFSEVSDSLKKKAFRDTITDFQTGSDKIDLSFVDANETKKGDQTFKFLKTEGRSFKNKPGSLIWDQIDKKGTSKDKTVVYADTDGNHKADMAIQLKGLVDLHKADFVL